jgi:predicted RNA-binding protein with PUA-like domain
MVDLKAVASLSRPISLAEIKVTPKLADMVLVNNSRLSVQPVTDAQWEIIMALSEKTL